MRAAIVAAGLNATTLRPWYVPDILLESELGDMIFEECLEV
jgi:hypothetical protein